nr:hybrid sensor histidine kinase/response regulator [Bacteroidota bacterium]
MNKQGIILIADDNENNLKVLSTMLRDSNYTIRIAKNGKQVLNSVAISLPDLILLDIHMPEMDGYETCERLKKSPVFKDIPVIFISALTETFNKVHAFRIGGVDYITKPFQIEEVRARVETHMLLRRKTVDLENALTEIKQVQAQLIHSEKMASLGVLSAGIAHEINNPINFVYAGVNSLIKNFKELAKAFSEFEHSCDHIDHLNGNMGYKSVFEKYGIDKKLKLIPQLADDIKTGAARTAEIIKGLKNFARTDTEEKVTCDVREPLKTALLLLKNSYKNRIEIIEKIETDLPVINCFPGLLMQVFVNILHNAIDAIDGNGKIAVTIAREEKNIRILIADTGKGIPEEVQVKIFDPFFTTKEVGKGMGLGLSITHGIIEKHRGTIKVQSKPGEGTEFDIRLPV